MSDKFTPRIGPTALRAWQRGDEGALRDELGIGPGSPCPFTADAGAEAPRGYLREYETALRLRRALTGLSRATTTPWDRRGG